MHWHIAYYIYSFLCDESCKKYLHFLVIFSKNTPQNQKLKMLRYTILSPYNFIQDSVFVLDIREQ